MENHTVNGPARVLHSSIEMYFTQGLVHSWFESIGPHEVIDFA